MHVWILEKLRKEDEWKNIMLDFSIRMLPKKK